MEPTGTAILMLDDAGDKYWRISNVADKDATEFETGEVIRLNPYAFGEGTQIKIYEKPR